MFDPTAYRADRYRGWYVTHHHGLTDALKLSILQAKDAEVGVWMATFREGALYGQERDSATLTVTAVEPARIDHEGDAYALLAAAPDQGEVELTAAAAAIGGDADGDGEVGISDFVILKNNFGAGS